MSDFNLSLNGSDARRYIDYLVEQRIEEKRKETHNSELPVIMCHRCAHFNNTSFYHLTQGRCEKHSQKADREGCYTKEVTVNSADHVCIFFTPSSAFRPEYERIIKKDEDHKKLIKAFEDASAAHFGRISAPPSKL